VLGPYRRHGVAVSLVDGDPREVVLAAAKARRADLIAVGKHDTRGRRLGAVASHLTRHAPCDVLIVPPER
jgi:nucleotide-binding universal stress UspA family protein